MPYVTVLPMKGIQWKTTGGSVGFLDKSCLRTFETMASTANEASVDVIQTAVEAPNRETSAAPTISASIPILNLTTIAQQLLTAEGVAKCPRPAKKLIGTSVGVPCRAPGSPCQAIAEATNRRPADSQRRHGFS